MSPSFTEEDDKEEEEEEDLLLPAVTESSGQPDLFSFPQNLDGFADTFLKFSADRPESIGRYICGPPNQNYHNRCS